MHRLTPAQRSTASCRDEVEELLSWFEYQQLPPFLRERSQLFHTLAHELVQGGAWTFELVASLRALLIAKDSGVRALLQAERLKAQKP